ncbi:MAG TPA: hypothetical protein VEW25_04240 [Allosphingosinicella sp.]|nr:hypothetical protein [Allosphingosinicella sp.]
MKKIILALAATTALAAAMPAAAQTAGGNVNVRIGDLQTQLQAGVRTGSITRSEAMPLREQLRQLEALERQYSVGGFTMQERSALQSRIANLRQGIGMAGGNGDDRADRGDRDDRWSDGRDCPPGLDRKNNGCLPPGQVGRDGRDDDRDGRWGGDDRSGDRIDRNRDGYDDRDLNRDRRIDANEWRMAGNGGYEDRDGRYDRDDDRYDDRDRRGGAGGVIDNLLGRNSLRVGQRVTADARLGSVPYEYRNQYRDGNGVYYRSDGRAIYQIDAGTDTVARIHALNR